MARVNGRYASILKGVSQQAPHDRLEGQMGEQVNMICDPVRGLVRRNGMLLRSQLVHDANLDTPAKVQATHVNAGAYRVYPCTINAARFAILFRSRARVLAGDTTPTLMAATLDYPQEFVTVVATPGMSIYESGGFSAVTSVGEYILMAGNRITPVLVKTDRWEHPDNYGRGMVYIASGGYNRTYTVKWDRNGVERTASLTTASGDYPGILDISGVDHNPSDTYQQRLNDVIYAYESAQNAWRVSSSEGIVPSAIAQALLEKINLADPGSGWVRSGATLIHPKLNSLYAEDNGSGDNLKFTFREVTAIDKLPPAATVGTVVKVRPLKNSEEAYYVEAIQAERNGEMQVSWRECAGTAQVPQRIFAMGRFMLTSDGYKFFVGEGPAELEALIAADMGTTPGMPAYIEVPKYAESGAGDAVSSPAPEFFDGPISMMTLWQDRLIIASGSKLSMSASGDYFNWFRKSMLTLADDDAVLTGARGVHGDVIRKSQIYDGHLMLFGDQYHYLIDGTQVVTPTQPRLKTQYGMAGTSGAAPETNGPFVFILKEDVGNGASTRLLQIKAGVWRDSTDVQDVSMQLRDYVNGTPAEVVALTSPSIVFVRTEEVPRSRYSNPVSAHHRFYVYQYTDMPDLSRPQESWSAWEYHPALGSLMGMSDNSDGDGLVLFTIAVVGGKRVINLMLASARSEPTGLPYIDGMQKGAEFEAGPYATGFPVVTTTDADLSFAQPDNSGLQLTDPWQSLGDAPPETVDGGRWLGVEGTLQDYFDRYADFDRIDNLWTGFQFPAYVDLTNPYYRNRFDKSIIKGKLVLTRLRCYLARSAGFRAWVRDHSRTIKSAEWSGEYRRQELHTSVAVGRDGNHCLIRLEAVDWYPMALTAIEWDANFFNNGRTM